MEPQRLMSGESDAALLERARRMEPDAWSEIHARTFDRVFGFVSALTGSADRAEDLAAGAFARAIDTLPRYSDRGFGAEPWLLHCAYLVVREARAAGPRLEPTGEAVRALWKLPEAERQVLAHRLIAGLDPRRISLFAGRRPWRLVRLQRRALRHLARVLGEPERQRRRKANTIARRVGS